MSVRLLSPGARIPRRSTSNAGYDLHACLADGEREIVLPPGTRRRIPTGVAVALRHGTFGQILSRSGLAVRHGLFVLTGTIDSDHRGEVQAVIGNFGTEEVTIRHGDRIAQMVILQHAMIELTEIDALDTTERGEEGFGSTGTHVIRSDR